MMSPEHTGDNAANDPASSALDAARALAESALGSRVTRIDTDRLGASNAVHFVTLADGDEYVVRISPQKQGALVEQELWAMGQASMRGVPTADVVFADTTRQIYDAPYMIMRRLPGVSAFGAALTVDERALVLTELGGHLHTLHSILIAGFGELEERDGRYVGCAASWRAYIHDEAAKRLAKLPPQCLPPELAAAIGDCFATADADLALERAVLLHGDYQFKNILLEKATVTGILDFETTIAGDPIYDFCALHYWSAEPLKALRSLLAGYGPLMPEPVFWRRLHLYTILLAIEILWWEQHFCNTPGIALALVRLREAVGAFEQLRDH